MKVTTDACLFGAWAAAEVAKATPPPRRILDIGAGTGLLTLMVAQQTEASILGIELNADATRQAKTNVELSPWKDRILIEQGDVFKWTSGHKFDVIICNPPFYENELASASASKNIAQHNPQFRIAHLLTIIDELLAPLGECFLLLPAKREKEMEGLIQEETAVIQKKVIVANRKDSPPIRIMYNLSRSPLRHQPQESVFIRGNDGSYSPEFVRLLKPYYLHL